ncbi:B12-binding domain-containing radical SAM protein [Maridesulfovibrio frigidus]|uniref:B12-binding domain-containing radical SAM protein n=1 Tax=Maridesulfovibrio frigidus TaxID=340956 RepID=UPI0004E1CF24|nr:radical SAM protein [Maridesulfovibrio frigidus]
MNKSKVCLIIPNYNWAADDERILWHIIPYNLCLLAAIIENDYDVTILDAYAENLTEEQFKDKLLQLKPDVVGLTVLMDQFAAAGHRCAAITKELLPKASVILGGVYATVDPETAIEDDNIDYVIYGEGEVAFTDLIKHLLSNGPLPAKGIVYKQNGKIINNGRADFVQNLDDFPLPAYHLIDYEKYTLSAPRKSVDGPRAFPFARIISSRGCPINCCFCQVKKIMGLKFRPRSANSVLDEIAWLKETYGIKSLIFDDDNLFTDRQRGIDILQGMIDRGLAMPWSSIATAVFMLDEELMDLIHRSGCEYMSISIESGTQRVLKEIIGKPIKFDHAKKMVKLAREKGIYVSAAFIVGFPTETWDEIRKTISYAEELETDYTKIFAAVPMRHTKLWDLCVEHNSFKKDFSVENISWHSGQIEGDEFTINDLTILRTYEWDRINFKTPEKIKNTADIMGITEEELLKIRRDTLLGAHENIST